MSLMTALDVLVNSPAGREYPTAQFCDLIPHVEQEFARECLGWELWNYMLTKLTPLPSSGYTEWQYNESYALNAVVVREGCMYKSAVANNDSDPLLNQVAWTRWEKFTDIGVNLLWNTYVKRILAYEVFKASLTPATWRSGAGGLVVSIGDGSGFRSATKNELIDVKNVAVSEINRTVTNMKEWLSNNASTYHLPYAPCKNGVCEANGQRSRRRWSFRQ